STNGSEYCTAARKVSCGDRTKRAYSHLYGETVKQCRIYHSHRSAAKSFLGFHWFICITASVGKWNAVCELGFSWILKSIISICSYGMDTLWLRTSIKWFVCVGL